MLLSGRTNRTILPYQVVSLFGILCGENVAKIANVFFSGHMIVHFGFGQFVLQTYLLVEVIK